MPHANKGKVKTPTDSAGMGSAFAITVRNEANLSDQKENQYPKPHEVEEHSDYTNEPSRELESSRGNISEKESHASKPLQPDNVIQTVHYKPQENKESQMLTHNSGENGTNNCNNDRGDEVEIFEILLSTAPNFQTCFLNS